MEIIPVLDIMSGVVVRARGGNRASYAPIETPLASTSDPIDVTQGYLNLYPFRRLYVADLDGIGGRGRNDHVLARLRENFPDVELWVDNGLAADEACHAWMELELGRLVLGSESQNDYSLPQRIGGILSLDFRGEAFLGPRKLLHDSNLWPEDVIVMTLSRIGMGQGPDIDRFAAVRKKAITSNVFAAGGVRDATDLDALRQAGAVGILVASALHDGRIVPHDLVTAPADERRSRGS